MNRKFCIFLFIFCEVANHFVALCKILSSQWHLTVVEGLNITILYAINDPVTGPKQSIYVVLCVHHLFGTTQVLYRLSLNSHTSLLSRYTAGYMSDNNKHIIFSVVKY